MTSIFLGSSEELAVDRRALGDFMGGVNDAYAPRGWRFRLVEWERESIAVARQEGGKQAEYNELVRACDLCLFLFRTRCGEYTMQEVEAALTEDAAESALRGAQIPLSPTPETGEALLEATRAAVDAELFAPARDLLRSLCSVFRDDVLFGVLRSIEAEPDR